jgi:hypothetical protein
LCSLEEKIKDLKEIYEEKQKNPEVQKMESLLPVQKNLSVEFIKHRRELVSIIKCVTQIACVGASHMSDNRQISVAMQRFYTFRQQPYSHTNASHCIPDYTIIHIITASTYSHYAFQSSRPLSRTLQHLSNLLRLGGGGDVGASHMSDN